MNLDDDFESSSWGKKIQSHGLYADSVDDSLDVSEPVIVCDDDDGTQGMNADRLARLARGQRQQVRRFGASASQNNQRFSGYELDEYDIELDDHVKLPHEAMEISNQVVDVENEEWDVGISDRVQRIIASGTRDIHQVEGPVSVPSYRPSRPLPSLAEAKVAFLQKVELKRLELKQHDLARSKADEERKNIEAELRTLSEELASARERLFELEKTLG